MDDQSETLEPAQTSPNSTPAGETVDETQIQSDAGQLAQFLKTDPAANATIDRILRQHLKNKADLEAWGRVWNGLVLYTGEDVAHFVLTVLLKSDDTAYLDVVKQHCETETWSYLRSLVALYSDSAKEANLNSGENPEGWKTIYRRVYYDNVTATWRATFEIVKYNGERVRLDETPSSAIVLCSGILYALNSVPVEDASKIADRNRVEELTSQAYKFVQLYAPDLLEEGETEQATQTSAQ